MVGPPQEKVREERLGMLRFLPRAGAPSRCRNALIVVLEFRCHSERAIKGRFPWYTPVQPSVAMRPLTFPCRTTRHTHLRRQTKETGEEMFYVLQKLCRPMAGLHAWQGRGRCVRTQ